MAQACGVRYGGGTARRRRRCGLSIGALFAALLSATSAIAADTERGMTVPLRAGIEPGAAISEKFRLYRSSKALVIGIDAYRAGWPRLTMAVEDARQVAAALERQGFDVTLKTDLDAVGLQSSLEDFFIVQGADPEARLFLWYAGHGQTLDGEGYLVPADAPRPDAGAAFKLKALPMHRLGSYVRLATARHAFAVFDACFAGTIFAARRALPPAAITYAATHPVRQFLTSGGADQTVSDDGAFRRLFLGALDGTEPADANRDGFLTASELGLFLNDRVTNLTGARQTPRYGKLSDRRFDRGDFVFALPPPPRLATPVAPAPAAEAPELTLWRSVVDSEDPVAFDGYLAHYPDGAFTAVARMRQKQLRDRLGASVGAPATVARPRRQPPEEVTWMAIRHSIDPVDFELYLARFPGGKYAGAARARLASLKSR